MDFSNFGDLSSSANIDALKKYAEQTCEALLDHEDFEKSDRLASMLLNLTRLQQSDEFRSYLSEEKNKSENIARIKNLIQQKRLMIRENLAHPINYFNWFKENLHDLRPNVISNSPDILRIKKVLGYNIDFSIDYNPLELIEICEEMLEALKTLNSLSYSGHYTIFRLALCLEIKKGKFLEYYKHSINIKKVFDDINESIALLFEVKELISEKDSLERLTSPSEVYELVLAITSEIE